MCVFRQQGYVYLRGATAYIQLHLTNSSSLLQDGSYLAEFLLEKGYEVDTSHQTYT